MTWVLDWIGRMVLLGFLIPGVLIHEDHYRQRSA